jgi:glycerol kinase
MSETTSLGAALAAGKAIGLCNLGEESILIKTDVFQPELSNDAIEAKLKKWADAIQRSLNWEEAHPTTS